MSSTFFDVVAKSKNYQKNSAYHPAQPLNRDTLTQRTGTHGDLPQRDSELRHAALDLPVEYPAEEETINMALQVGCSKLEY